MSFSKNESKKAGIIDKVAITPIVIRSSSYCVVTFDMMYITLEHLMSYRCSFESLLICNLILGIFF